MKRTRKHLVPILFGGLLVVSSIAANTIFLARPVAAFALPTVFAAEAGSPCSLPDDLPGQQSGSYLVDGYTCCPTGKTAPTSCLFAKYINPLIQVLSALVGIAVVISIIFGGIQYVTSTGDPQRAEAGKKRIIESLVGLVAFMLLYAFLQFVMPGGVFNGS